MKTVDATAGEKCILYPTCLPSWFLEKKKRGYSVCFTNQCHLLAHQDQWEGRLVCWISVPCLLLFFFQEYCPWTSTHHTLNMQMFLFSLIKTWSIESRKDIHETWFWSGLQGGLFSMIVTFALIFLLCGTFSFFIPQFLLLLYLRHFPFLPSRFLSRCDSILKEKMTGWVFSLGLHLMIHLMVIFYSLHLGFTVVSMASCVTWNLPSSSLQ